MSSWTRAECILLCILFLSSSRLVPSRQSKRANRRWRHYPRSLPTPRCSCNRLSPPSCRRSVHLPYCAPSASRLNSLSCDASANRCARKVIASTLHHIMNIRPAASNICRIAPSQLNKSAAAATACMHALCREEQASATPVSSALPCSRKTFILFNSSMLPSNQLLHHG